MNSVKSIFIVVALGLCLIGTSSCKGKSGQKDSKESETRTTVQTTLFDKSFRKTLTFYTTQSLKLERKL